MSVNISDGHIGGAVGTGEVIENVITDMYLGITSQAFALTVGGVVGLNRLILHRGSAYGTMLISGGIYPIFDNNYHTIGGVVGKAIGEVSESSNKSKMTVTIDPRNQHMNVNVGGIAGGIDGFIKYCTSYGEITISSHASVYAGGLTGIIYHEAIVTNSIALTTISYEGTSEENVCIGGIAGYTLDRFSARKLYYSQEVGLDKAVGNFNDSELTDVENYSLNYYLNNPELDYLDDKFDIYKGHYPDLLHRFF